MVPIPKDVPSIGQIKRQTAEENLINHEEWFSWGKGEKRETMVIFPKKGLWKTSIEKKRFLSGMARIT